MLSHRGPQMLSRAFIYGSRFGLVYALRTGTGDVRMILIISPQPQ